MRHRDKRAGIVHKNRARSVIVANYMQKMRSV
jgi:hypothetical protein